jgi:hypothetical protein
MARRVSIVLFIGVLALFLASCGQTYELQSITLSPVSPNLEGIGASQQLTVIAHYSNTKTQEVSVKSTYVISSAPGGLAPMSALAVNTSGIVQAVGAACTWTDAVGGDGKTYVYATSAYEVTAMYSGLTTKVFVSVASAAGCYDGQAFPAPPLK